MELRNPMGEIGFREIHNGLCLDTREANVSPTLHFRVLSSRKPRLNLDVWECFESFSLQKSLFLFVAKTLNPRSQARGEDLKKTNSLAPWLTAAPSLLFIVFASAYSSKKKESVELALPGLSCFSSPSVAARPGSVSGSPQEGL